MKKVILSRAIGLSIIGLLTYHFHIETSDQDDPAGQGEKNQDNPGQIRTIDRPTLYYFQIDIETAKTVTRDMPIFIKFDIRH